MLRKQPSTHAPSGVTAAISSPLRASSNPQMGEGATGLRLRSTTRMVPSSSCKPQVSQIVNQASRRWRKG